MQSRNRTVWTVLIAAGLVVGALVMGAMAQEKKLLGYEDVVPQPTFGGKQFWNDQYFLHGWHIQSHASTGHCRLLDAQDKRYAWGTFDGCKTKLDEIRRDEKLPPMRGKAVIVLHGLFRSHESMASLADYLREKGGYKVFNVEYSSTQIPIEEMAKNLALVVESLEGIEEINFVGHSLGNIVVRRYLYDHLDPKTGKPTDKPTDKRLRRMVMLAPPNHGSVLAQVLANNAVFSVNGFAGQELGVGWETLDKKLVTPPLEFGIIAGGKGDDEGHNTLLRGDDDGTVSVATTRLVGASDFTLLPVTHTFIMDNPTVQERTLQFLKHGYFTTKKERRPIE